MDLIFLVGTLLAAIILVVVLIMRLHLHAFVSLVIACFFVGFVTGMPLLQICKSIEAGMGSTLGFLATVLGFGSILGKMLETSGGAERLARTLINRFGKKKANWAMMFVGLITGIPVFFQVGFVLLIPLVISVARATGLSIIAIGVPIGVSLQVVHCMLPPHPAAMAIVDTLGADVGKVILLGLLICTICAAVGGPIWTSLIHKRISSDMDSVRETYDEVPDSELPNFGITLLTILLPMIIMVSKTLFDLSPWKGTEASMIIDFIGNPITALLISAFFAYWSLGLHRGRMLGPDMYFKHYYLNEQGDPCAGYRADRYYQSRQGNVQMRKQWADIVNRKFQELGIDQEVSEKTLEAQRQDLLAQGRFEEAEQFDRIPAPHLGDAYKNPKTVERIKEKVREIDEQTEYPGCSADQAAETDNNDDVVEQKIVCFATDKVLRRVTKEIQQARQRLRQEDIQRLEARIAAEQDDAEAEALANKPIVVTIRDVYEELEYRAEEEAKKRTQMLVFYKDIKKQIIPDRFLRNAAIERLIGSDYRNTKKRLNRIQEELVPMEQKYIELKDIPYAEKKEFYLSYSDKLRQKQALEQKIKAYHEELNKREDEIQTIMDELKAENESHKERLKNLYGKINKSERMEKIYSEKAMEIKNNVSDFDKILYSRKMPRLVMRHCSLDGETPLTNYQIIPYQGKAFVILSDVPTEPWERQKKTALLLGDTVEKGKANVYVVTMYSEGKDISGVSKTTEQVRLYANAKTAMELQTGKGNHYSPQIQNVQQRRKSEIVGKIEEFLRAATENTNGRYHAWWDDEEPRKKKDKLKQVEEDLYRGWNM